MRSGKGTAALRNNRARRFSAPRILASSLVLVAICFAALHYANRTPTTLRTDETPHWQSPPFDIASWENRRVLDKAMFGQLNTFEGRWIGDSCYHEASSPRSAIFILGREGSYDGTHRTPASRIHVQLWEGSGRATIDTFDGMFGPGLGRRVVALDAEDADSFMALVLKNGYADMEPSPQFYPLCHPGREQLLQSCINGRYFAVYRRCERRDDVPNLTLMGERIDEFLRTRASR